MQPNLRIFEMPTTASMITTNGVSWHGIGSDVIGISNRDSFLKETVTHTVPITLIYSVKILNETNLYIYSISATVIWIYIRPHLLSEIPLKGSNRIKWSKPTRDWLTDALTSSILQSRFLSRVSAWTLTIAIKMTFSQCFLFSLYMYIYTYLFPCVGCCEWDHNCRLLMCRERVLNFILSTRLCIAQLCLIQPHKAPCFYCTINH